MIERMKIGKANQYHLLANHDKRHENSESKPMSSLNKPMIEGMKIVRANQYHLLVNYDTTHENSESKSISSLSKL